MSCYDRQNFVDGQVLTAECLNKMEVGILRGSAPRNLLDNSDFSNPIAQAGLNGKHGTTAYICDRWVSGGITAEQQDGFLRLTATVRAYQTRQYLDYNLQGKAITVACKAVAGSTFYVGLYYVVDGTSTSISFSSTTGVNGVVCKTGTVPANATNLEFRIYPAYVEGGGYADVYWAALYEGEYTADTLPEYQPKGYSAELAECQRYYYRLAPWTLIGSGAVEWNGTGITINVPIGTQMRVNPSVPNAPTVNVRMGAGDNQVISGVTPAANVIGNTIALGYTNVFADATHAYKVACLQLSDLAMEFIADL